MQQTTERSRSETGGQVAARVLRFDEPGADDKALVGGKGANLGRCAQAGFPVPAGFTITCDAYADFLELTGLSGDIERILTDVDFADLPELEAKTAQIRAAIVQANFPVDLSSSIAPAYASLGPEVHVAVRSSGTAEDLAEASFAGLHDTLLDVRGMPALLDAVRRCWASLWTARATAYRHDIGMEVLSDIRMAVVVQLMVAPEVAGVMFTANPVTAATDELVVNASWGLGESVVSGLVTPDEHVIKVRRPVAVGIDERSVRAGADATLEIKQRTIGSKEVRVVRNPSTNQGTVTESVDATERALAALSDDQVLELAELGRRAQAFYDYLPQDIEWAYADGEFHLLQARPITGVPFDWAADMETWQVAPDDDTTLWTGAWAHILTGAKSPLYYHWSTDVDIAGYHSIGNMLGIPELMGPAFTNQGSDVNRPAELQIHKYHRGEVYHNTEFEKILQARFFPPPLRAPGVSPWISPEQAEEVQNTPFNYFDFLRGLARIELLEPQCGITRWHEVLDQFIEEAPVKWDVRQIPELRSLSDSELQKLIDRYWVDGGPRFTSYAMIVFLVYLPQVMVAFGRILGEWYDGDNPEAFGELCQGVSTHSKTLEENLLLYELAQDIRRSPTLSATFVEHTGAAFFDALVATEDGRAFLGRYRDFVRLHGHRGHEDRDFSYPRRYEDPSIDYRNFAMLLSVTDDSTPLVREQALTERRDAVYRDVVENLQSQPLTGGLKATAFKLVHAQVQKLLRYRDDERWAYEHSVLCMKLLFQEAGRRLARRGVLSSAEDYYLFSKDELYELLEGRGNTRLAQAKATARRQDFTKVRDKMHDLPAYLRDGKVVSVDSGERSDGLQGTGWTSGLVTATARVVTRLSEIDRVEPGDILVCTSTDPGWTPVFMLLSGIVTESGGVLSHSSCLAREYGLPAVQLANARKLIPDGATVTLNGTTGEVIIVDSPALSEASKEPVSPLPA